MGYYSTDKESGNFNLNRRSSKRIKFLKKIKFGINEAVFPGSSYNISQYGMLLHSFKAFLPSTVLIVKIFTDSEIFNLNAEVKWVTKTFDHSGSFMGLHFVGKNIELGKLYLKELELNQVPS